MDEKSKLELQLDQVREQLEQAQSETAQKNNDIQLKQKELKKMLQDKNAKEQNLAQL